MLEVNGVTNIPGHFVESISDFINLRHLRVREMIIEQLDSLYASLCKGKTNVNELLPAAIMIRSTDATAFLFLWKM